ncbi:hypothetical protein [Geodermatophilus sp. DSM 44513]|uniref:hypothetical protein n=1 Tax=Geodermatophilus sp. DSM 44513 TaxID=1528104 RepID=UPI00126B93C6|nr:hypothetical protein [Geodermatophilus sp. DSM 44513]WNV74778.1 hypothetical protein RTG05_17540 [Geodermatophilus sp. DSM 44513]
MSGVSSCVAGLLLIVALTGCGQAAGTRAAESGGDSPPSDPPELTPSSAAVTPDVACPAQESSRLSGDTGGPMDAYVCSYEIRTVPGDGSWSFHVVRRVTGGLGALLEAYRSPDEPPVADMACTAAGVDPLVVHLHDEHGTRAVRAPVGPCSAPTESAKSAYASLITAVVGEQQEGQSRSQLSVDTSCPDETKDVLSIEQPPQRGDPTPTPLSAPVSVCMYRVAAEEGMRVGYLEAHRTLTADQVAGVNAALDLVRPDRGCSRVEHRRFAVLFGSQPGRTVIALDGCAVSQDAGWWRADDHLRRAVGG